MFSASFANRLNGICYVTASEAENGIKLRPNHAYVAPGDAHLRIEREGGTYIGRLDTGPAVNRHRPSVDVLFDSVAACAGKNAVGIILTGTARAIGTHLPWFNCPERKDERLTPLSVSNWPYRNAGTTEGAATISYGANWGDTVIQFPSGPRSLDDGPSDSLPKGTGVVFWRSKLQTKHIEDGMSKTYFISEYHWSFDPTEPTLGENYYGIGTPLGGGYVTTAAHAPKKDGIRDTQLPVDELGRMGSAHNSTFNVAFCDGSVRAMDYGIEPVVHLGHANRRDGR